MAVGKYTLALCVCSESDAKSILTYESGYAQWIFDANIDTHTHTKTELNIHIF